MATNVAEFTAALVAAFPTVAAFRTMLSEGLNWNLDRLAGVGNLDDRVNEVVVWAIANGRERELYDAARAKNEGNLQLKAMEAQLPPPSPFANVNQFDNCFPRSKPFINRKALRKAIKRLADGNGPRVLVIDGDPQTGKSYSLFYIHHVAERCNFDVVDIDLKTAYPGQIIDADSIARDIATQMDLGEPPKSDEQGPRRSRVFCNWLTGKLRNSPRTWWVVIDHCDIPLPEDVVDLFCELARRTDVSWKNMRLVLLSNSVEVPLLSDQSPERERVAVIDLVHITEFVIQFRQQLGLADNDHEVQRVLREILKRVDQSSPRRTHMIGIATEQQCRVMMGEG